MTHTLKALIESNRFTQFITALILVNAVTLGLETSQNIMASHGPWLLLLDRSILAVFCIEIALKLYVYRLSFFKSGWNIFDLSIVAISLIPATGALSVMRAFRILRVLRLFSVVPAMRRVINALFTAIPGMTSVIGVLLIVFYVAAVLTTKLFGVSPDPQMQELFGTIGASMYTLFQIMTLEGWSDGVVRPALELYPWAWAFFIPFIIITSFAVLNLFIGIIVDAMQRGHKAEHAEEEQADRAAFEALQRDVQAIKSMLEEQRKNTR